MNTIWIAASNSDEYGRIYLPDYAGVTKYEVISKVMDGCRKEKLGETITGVLSALGWEIVKVKLTEIQPL